MMQEEEKINVLFVSNHHYPFGMASSKRIRLFVENLPSTWIRSVIVTGNDNGRNVVSGEHNGIDFRLVRFSIFSYLFNVMRVCLVLLKGGRKGYKNILFLYGNIRITNFWFAVVGSILSYKVVTDIVEDDSILDQKLTRVSALKIRLSVWLQGFLEKLVDGAVVISTQLQKKHKYLNKTVLISISAENLLVSRQKQIEDNKIVRFVYSGTFRAKDGIEILISSFKNEIKPEEGELWFSGTASEEHIQMMRPIANIRFNGLIPDEDYYQYLQNADALLMTRTDSAYANTGFPFKVGEFLATGNPVICTDVGDITEYLTDGTDCILAKASNEESLRKAFRYVIENREKAVQIGLNGKKSCSKWFDPQNNGDLLATFLRDI